jgi:RNA polymerase sigma-70 factor (ECF subfamily)
MRTSAARVLAPAMSDAPANGTTARESASAIVSGSVSPTPERALAASRADAMVSPAIIHRAKAGDAQAFAALVDAYYPRCLRFARHMLGDAEDAEEAVQDAFVRVYGALSRYREDERFEPWLFRILANRCRTSRARAVRHARVIAYVGVPADGDATATARVDAAESWSEEIQRALAMLPDEQREAFLLRHVEGLMYEEMLEITGAGVSALKMRVKRACDFLRVRLREVTRG